MTEEEDAAESDKLQELSKRVIACRKALREAEAEHGELYQARRNREQTARVYEQRSL